MLPTEFVLFSNHEALRYLSSQKKLNARHAKWVEFLNEYSFVINHRAGIENKVVDALSRLTMTLHRMSAQVIEFDRLKMIILHVLTLILFMIKLVMVTVMSMLTFLLKMVICLK